MGGQTCDHLRDVPLENVFKLSASAAATEFCEWASLDTHLYGRVAAIVYTNYFFHLYQQNKSYKSKLTFRQASYCWKKVLEAAKLPYANKTKEIINFQKPESQDFW